MVFLGLRIVGIVHLSLYTFSFFLTGFTGSLYLVDHYVNQNLNSSFAPQELLFRQVMNEGLFQY